MTMDAKELFGWGLVVLIWGLGGGMLSFMAINIRDLWRGR